MYYCSFIPPTRVSTAQRKARTAPPVVHHGLHSETDVDRSVGYTSQREGTKRFSFYRRAPSNDRPISLASRTDSIALLSDHHHASPIRVPSISTPRSSDRYRGERLQYPSRDEMKIEQRKTIRRKKFTGERGNRRNWFELLEEILRFFFFFFFFIFRLASIDLRFSKKKGVERKGEIEFRTIFQ